MHAQHTNDIDKGDVCVGCYTTVGSMFRLTKPTHGAEAAHSAPDTRTSSKRISNSRRRWVLDRQRSMLDWQRSMSFETRDIMGDQLKARIERKFIDLRRRQELYAGFGEA